VLEVIITYNANTFRTFKY